jgi:1-aminocyclopropane-1-carboxylate deaminase/D-cysteine desulfhydrase-like pyridoxal-dependent ACC family enzyme
MPAISTLSIARQAPRALDRLLATPRVALADWPTPIDTIVHPRGPAVLVKRDDRSGWGRGGAKARKIEHLLGHMRAHERDELVTVVGNITNLAFDLVPALDQAGLRGSLFVIDDPPTPPEERERIFAGVRDRVTLLGPSRFAAVRAVVTRWLAARRQGRRPMWTLPGVSHPAAVVGNAQGLVEMVVQRVRQRQPIPRVVYVTAATGTTVAGFLLGAHVLRLAGYPAIRVVGVQIYPGAMRRSVSWLLRWAERWLRLPTRVPRADIDIVSSALDGGFGCFSNQLADDCLRLAADTGLHIDPIFGGKTWAAMGERLARERAADQSALYWHCGYTPEWATLRQPARRGS